MWQVYNGSNHANNGSEYCKYVMVWYGKCGMVSMVSI